MGCFGRFLSLRNDLKLVGLSLGAFLALIDIYTAMISFYTIGIDTQTPWMAIWTVIGHQIAFGASIPFFEGLVDMNYQRAVFIISSVLFSASSAAASWTDAAALIAGLRAVKGLGAAGLFTAAAADPSPTAQKATKCAKLLGPLWGGLIGAACMEYKGWTWIYWLNGVSGVFTLICYLCGGKDDDEWFGNSVQASLMDLDGFGAVLFAAAVFFFVLASQQGVDALYENELALPTLGIIITGLFVLAMFWFWERKSTQKFKFLQLAPNGSDNNNNSSSSSTTLYYSRALLSAGLAGFVWDAIVFSLTLGYQLVDTPYRFFEYNPALWSAIRLLVIIISSRIGIFIGATAINNKGFLSSDSISLTANVLMTFSVGMFALSGRFPVSFFNTLQCVAMGLGYGLHLAAYDYIGINDPSTLSRESSSYLLSSRIPSSDEEEGGVEPRARRANEDENEDENDEEDDEEDEDMEMEDFLSPTQSSSDNKPSQPKLESIRVFGGVIGISLVHMILHYYCRKRSECGKAAFEKSFTVTAPLVLFFSLCTFVVLFFVGRIRTAYSKI